MLHVSAHVEYNRRLNIYTHTHIYIYIYIYIHIHAHTHIYILEQVMIFSPLDFGCPLKTDWMMGIFKCHRCLSEVPDNNVLLLRIVEGYFDIQWCSRMHMIFQCRLCCCINHSDIPLWEYQHDFCNLSLHWGWAVWQKCLWKWGTN